ncbi:PepSY domain-containing protein [Myxococcota bacterium]|nr:PepSY domain-containing protein [Myxococcota bacterium]
MSKRFFKFSKAAHEYLGLLILPFLMWMSVSGILLNHPELIETISFPQSVVPEVYYPQNWNRSSLITQAFSRKNPDVAWVAGKKGIWQTRDKGLTYTSFMGGDFPDSHFLRKTNYIHLTHNQPTERLFAATDGGLFVSDRGALWQELQLGDERERIVKILQREDELIVAGESHLWTASLQNTVLDFTPIQLLRDELVPQVTLIQLFFELHDGKVLGLFGKLVMDLVGGIIFILSLTALYTWVSRKISVRRRKKLNHPRFFKFLMRYHFQLGIWAVFFMLLIGMTGLFMRPPLLGALVGGTIDATYFPGFLDSNRWHKKIQNAVWLENSDQILLQATDGMWLGQADFKTPFSKTTLPLPVFVMGATVFEYEDDKLLMGSFNGLFRIDLQNGTAIDELTGLPAKDVDGARPQKKMVAGYFKTPEGERFITTHKDGLLALSTASFDGRFKMPERLRKSCRMPLWNYVFELHNGRIFRPVIGAFYILLVPLGSLFFVFISISGAYDWIYRKRPALRAKKSGPVKISKDEDEERRSDAA